MNRGRSKQDVGTDPKFIEAVKRRFGPIAFDLAASDENAKAPNYYRKEDNSLIQLWHEIKAVNGVLWLNCEYDQIEPWVMKCASESSLICKPILLLVPASVGANWFKHWVVPSAHVIFLNGRLTFEGHTQPYPKDLCLAVYFAGITGFSTWTWNK